MLTTSALRSILARQSRVLALSSSLHTTSRCLEKADSNSSNSKLPFGLDKILGLGEPDNLIATNADRKIAKSDIPDFIPEDLKKDMKDMEITTMNDLDEMEEENVDGYNDLGLVPPEGSGTFASPILIPSRRASRQVGYVDPVSHAMYWFTIHNDENTYYIKDLGLFFKMLHIPDESMSAGHH